MRTTDKKAKILEKDIKNLVNFAFKNEISEKRMVELAENAYDKYKEKTKTSKNLFYTSLVVLIVIIAFVFSYNATWDFVHALIRIGLVKIFPLWDWTYLSDLCLIKNPEFSIEQISNQTFDCTVCEDLERIEKVIEVDSTKLDQTIYEAKVPLIVPGTALAWKATQLFDLDFLTNLFNSNKYLHTSLPCSMQVTIDATNFTSLSHFPSLLNDLKVKSRNKDSVWHAFWEICNLNANRVLRKFYKKPSFIGPSIEMLPYHWLILASNHDHAKFVQVDIGSSVGWLVQLKGRSKVLLQYADCQETCKELYAVLNTGDIILWPNDLMRFSYKAQLSPSHVSIAALFGGAFD